MSLATVPLTTFDFNSAHSPRGEEGFGALATEKGNLPLKTLSVNARIIGLCAEVTLEQTFVNVHRDPILATYIFPLPDRAAVSRFVMTVGDRTTEGILKERGEARQDFDRAIAQGRRAAITEEERPGVFTMRVGNLMPRDVAKVTLTMTVPLTFEDNEATFRFPLVVAPRYIPGKLLGGDQAGDGTEGDTDAVPDASRISPPVLLKGCPNPVRLSLRCEIDPAGLPLAGIASALHAVWQSGNVVEINPGERVDRDFVLRLAFRSERISSGAAVCGDVFRLAFLPPKALSELQRPRDIIFVLDHSGSMEGWKMIAARRACQRIVDTLTPADRFTVYAFDDSISTPWKDLRHADSHTRFEALEFLGKVEAAGGTEMLQPLQNAAKALRDSHKRERDAVIVLLTDGQVGNEDQILAKLKADMQHVRMFSCGIDRAVNEAFLRRLATLGGGAMEIVESEERLDDAMDRIHKKVGTPVLTDISISGEGVDIDASSLAPDRFPALFAGVPLEVGGRVTYRHPRAALVVRAKDATGRLITESVALTETNNRAVEAMWARARVRALEDRYVTQNGGAKLEAEIVETSLRYNVLCRFTAFVAVDHSRVVNPGSENRAVMQPVEAPDGWGMLGKADDMQTRTGSVGGGGIQKLMQSMSSPMRAKMAAPASAAPPPAPKSPAPMADLSEASFDEGGEEEEAEILASKEEAPLARAVAESTDDARAEKQKKGGRAQAGQDLSHYAQRIDELVRKLRQWKKSDETGLRVIMLRLRSLFDDLVRVGVTNEHKAAADAAFFKLEDLFRLGEPTSDELEDKVDALRIALTDLAANLSVGNTPPTKPARKSFWKR